jgi:hypothetical protein
MPSTPMGLRKSGEGSFIPNSSIDKSRVEQSTIIRGRPCFERGEIHRDGRQHAAQARSIDVQLIVAVMSHGSPRSSLMSLRQPILPDAAGV